MKVFLKNVNIKKIFLFFATFFLLFIFVPSISSCRSKNLITYSSSKKVFRDISGKSGRDDNGCFSFQTNDDRNKYYQWKITNKITQEDIDFLSIDDNGYLEWQDCHSVWIDESSRYQQWSIPFYVSTISLLTGELIASFPDIFYFNIWDANWIPYDDLSITNDGVLTDIDDEHIDYQKYDTLCVPSDVKTISDFFAKNTSEIKVLLFESNDSININSFAFSENEFLEEIYLNNLDNVTLCSRSFDNLKNLHLIDFENCMIFLNNSTNNPHYVFGAFNNFSSLKVILLGNHTKFNSWEYNNLQLFSEINDNGMVKKSYYAKDFLDFAIESAWLPKTWTIGMLPNYVSIIYNGASNLLGYQGFSDHSLSSFNIIVDPIDSPNLFQVSIEDWQQISGNNEKIRSNVPEWIKYDNEKRYIIWNENCVPGRYQFRVKIQSTIISTVFSYCDVIFILQINESKDKLIISYSENSKSIYVDEGKTYVTTGILTATDETGQQIIPKWEIHILTDCKEEINWIEVNPDGSITFKDVHKIDSSILTLKFEIIGWSQTEEYVYGTSDIFSLYIWSQNWIPIDDMNIEYLEGANIYVLNSLRENISYDDYDTLCVPNYVNVVSDLAFFNEFTLYKNSSISNLIFQDESKCSTISCNAFQECYALKRVYIGQSVNSIEAGAFASAGIEILEFCSTQDSNTINLFNGCFYNCKNLKEINFGLAKINVAEPTEIPIFFNSIYLDLITIDELSDYSNTWKLHKTNGKIDCSFFDKKNFLTPPQQGKLKIINPAGEEKISEDTAINFFSKNGWDMIYSNWYPFAQ